MSRVIAIALVIAALPPACAKLLGKKTTTDDPSADTATTVAMNDPPPPSGTTPPIWHPPDTTPAPVDAGPAVIPPAADTADLTRAQALFDSKDYKKAKGVLDKRIKAGKCVPDEVTLLLKTCTQLKDSSCVSGTKKACPPPPVVPNTKNDPVQTGF